MAGPYLTAIQGRKIEELERKLKADSVVCYIGTTEPYADAFVLFEKKHAFRIKPNGETEDLIPEYDKRKVRGLDSSGVRHWRG